MVRLVEHSQPILLDRVSRAPAAGQVGWEKLDRDLALKAWVMRLGDHAHAPARELEGDLVRVELCAAGQGHARARL